MSDKVRRMMMVFGMLAILGAFSTACWADSNSYYYGTRAVNGKTYHVYLEDTNGSAALWFRVVKDACSTGDIKMLDMVPASKSVPQNTTLKDYAKTLCTVKNVYDNGKTILGCGSVAATGICLSATVPTGGVAAAACTVTFRYAAAKGFADCVDGISDWIGGKLAGDRDWQLYQTAVNITNTQ